MWWLIPATITAATFGWWAYASVVTWLRYAPLMPMDKEQIGMLFLYTTAINLLVWGLWWLF